MGLERRRTAARRAAAGLAALTGLLAVAAGARVAQGGLRSEGGPAGGRGGTPAPEVTGAPGATTAAGAATAAGRPYTDRHEEYMRAAIEMGKLQPSNPYGAVIVNTTTGEVVCRGVNNHANNPTFHGEMQAINDCARTWPQLKGDGAKAEWAKLVLYTTAEPCPMCMAAIEWCGMPHMYYGTGLWELEKMGLHQIDVESRYISSKKNFGTPCQITGGILSDITNKMFEASKNHTANHRHNCSEHGHARPEGLLEELPRD